MHAHNGKKGERSTDQAEQQDYLQSCGSSSTYSCSTLHYVRHRGRDRATKLTRVVGTVYVAEVKVFIRVVVLIEVLS